MAVTSSTISKFAESIIFLLISKELDERVSRALSDSIESDLNFSKPSC